MVVNMKGEKKEVKKRETETRNKNTSYAQIFDAPCARRRIALAKNQSINSPDLCQKRNTEILKPNAPVCHFTSYNRWSNFFYLFVIGFFVMFWILLIFL